MKKLYSKEKFTTREEWLSNRSLGGSSASALFGANPYQSLLDVYCASINPNIKDSSNESMQYGTRCEGYIRKLVEINYEGEYKVQSPNGFTMYRRIDKPYLTATLDGIMKNLNTNEKWVLEIKTHDVRNKADLENWEEHLPQNYFIQGLHYLVVMNDFVGVLFACKLRFFDFFNEDGKKLLKEEIRYYRITRKDFEKDIALLEERETNFYENNILKKVPPRIEIAL